MKSWGWDARERRDYRLSQRVWIMRCSHNAKIWVAYVTSVDSTSSTFEIHVMSCRNVYLTLWKWEALGPEQIKASELSHRLWCSCDSANRLHMWKELNFASVLFGKAFCLEPKWELVLVISSLNARERFYSRHLLGLLTTGNNERMSR